MSHNCSLQKKNSVAVIEKSDQTNIVIKGIMNKNFYGPFFVSYFIFLFV